MTNNRTKRAPTKSSKQSKNWNTEQSPQALSEKGAAKQLKGLFAPRPKVDIAASVKKALQQLNVYVELQAAPGAGKTTALSARIDWLLAAGVPASDILVLSFARKSVDHFCTRLGPAALQVTVSTGHAFGLKLVKTNARLLGLKKVPKVLADKRVTAMLRRTVKNVAEQVLKTTSKKAQRIATRAWFEALTGNTLSRLQTLLEIQATSERKLAALVAEAPFAEWRAYLDHVKLIRKEFKRLKAQAGVIHFADMIGLATQAIEAGAKVGYTHVLVDEYQDSSPQQVAMLTALAAQTTSVVVAGDPLQAIYGWAGSRYTSFEVQGQQVERLSMSASHRLTAANAAFACTLMTKPVDAIQTTRRGPVPILYDGKSHLQQAREVATQIKKLVKDGTSPSAIAVLARQKKQLRAVHAGLLGSVPCRLTELGEDEELAARDAPLQVLRLLRKLSKVTEGDTTGELAPAQLRRQLAEHVPRDADWDRAAAGLRAVRSGSLAGQLAQVSRVYLQLCGGQAANKHLRNRLNLWAANARGITSLQKLKATVSAQADVPASEGVTLATIHAAKGDEWKHVFVLGVTEGVLPDYRSREGHALEEERRLLYVAATRAQKSLRLFSAPHLLKTGAMAEGRSHFLHEPIRSGVIRVKRSAAN